MRPLPPAPLWFLLLPVLAALAWLPTAGAWQSDDWLLLERTADLSNVLADWLGPQFGASDLWWFHRPVVTTSFWLDVQFQGESPLALARTNVLLHALGALLLAFAWRRVATDATAFLAGLLWAVSPTHAGAVLWIAGRSDLLATLFTLASILAMLRGMEGSRCGRTASLLMLLLALCSKEVAFAAPPLLSAIAFLLAPPGERLRIALRTTAPHWILFGLVLLGRLIALGTLGGGYSGTVHEPLAMVAGFLGITVRLLLPPAWMPNELWLPFPGPFVLGGPMVILPWLGLALFLLVGMVLAARFRREVFCSGLLLFTIACVPMAGFLATPDQFHNLRYFHLALGALCGVIACGSRMCAFASILAWLSFLLPVGLAYGRATRESDDLRRAIESALPAQASDELMFVAGLPHAGEQGLVLQYHFGVDRVARGRARLLPLRPAIESPTAFRLWDEDRNAFAIPGSRTFRAEPNAMLVAVDPQPLPALPLGDVRSFDCSAAALGRMATHAETPEILLPGLRRPWYRVTVFTALGTFCVLVPDGPDDGLDGRIGLRELFTTASWGTEQGANLLLGLRVPAIHDLHTDFPVLVEAGERTENGFVASHRARELLTFRFDRQLPAFVRAATGQ